MERKEERVMARQSIFKFNERVTTEAKDATYEFRDPVISVRNLEKKFGEHEVLKDISFDLFEGDVVCIIGSSGSGKSTLLRCINHLETPTSGQILYHGYPLAKDAQTINRFRSQVGMVFQQPNPFPMSIYDNIAYGPRIHGIKNKKQLDKIVKDSLEAAALYEEVKDRLHSSALGLSGGQQQRLCIARALAVEPDVILLDEPTSALDPISTLKIEELLMELKEKYTIAIVTHNMQQASRIADYTAFFLVGEMVEYGKTKDVFAMPKDKRTEDYITGRFG